jgi:hypothetical protein
VPPENELYVLEVLSGASTKGFAAAAGAFSKILWLPTPGESRYRSGFHLNEEHCPEFFLNLFGAWDSVVSIPPERLVVRQGESLP